MNDVFMGHVIRQNFKRARTSCGGDKSKDVSVIQLFICQSPLPSNVFFDRCFDDEDQDYSDHHSNAKNACSDSKVALLRALNWLNSRRGLLSIGILGQLMLLH